MLLITITMQIRMVIIKRKEEGEIKHNSNKTHHNLWILKIIIIEMPIIILKTQETDLNEIEDR